MDVDEALVGCGQQLQRRLEPAGGGGRSARGAGRPGGEQHRDGLLVTPARVLLDVMGALGRGGAARGEGCCGPRVGREPPAPPVPPRRPHAARADGGRRTGAEPASSGRDRRGAARRARRAPRPAGSRRSPPRGRARTARPRRRRLGAAAAPPREETRAPRRATPRRRRARDAGHVDARRVSVDRGQAPLLLRALQLLQVERVAAAVATDRRGHLRLERPEQLGRLRLVERPERDPVRRRHGERRRQAGRRLPGAEREREQHRRLRLAAQQGSEQLDRRVVAPVQVVEDEDERPLAREELEQRANRPVRAIALVGDRRRAPSPPGPDGRNDRRRARPTSSALQSASSSSSWDAT